MLEAAASDAEVGRMLAGWKQQRAEMLRQAVRPLAPPAGQRARLAAGTKEVLRALSAPEVYSKLVTGAGLAAGDYHEWLASSSQESCSAQVGSPCRLYHVSVRSGSGRGRRAWAHGLGQAVDSHESDLSQEETRKMSEEAIAFAVEPGQGETIQGPAGGPLTFKARGAQTGGQLTLFENVIAPGDGPPLHRHAGEDESWYVLEGQLRFRLGGELHNAPSGAFVFVPRGTPHCFQNTGAMPARIIVIFTPSGMERFFDRFAALPKGSDPRPAFAEIGREVGMEVVGPPLAVSHPL